MIELKLKNFKCFENKTFNFKDEMVLISAPSGSGKTSILSAIKFALWGSGKTLTKGEIMHGKNSCSVTLTYNDITIQRTKRPNRLVYTKQNEIYEDNEAQIYINKYFGNQSHNNFLESSSSDKTEYLEKMAFGKSTEIIELMKENTKENIRSINDETNNTEGQLSLTKKLLKSVIDDWNNRMFTIVEPQIPVFENFILNVSIYEEKDNIEKEIESLKLKNINHSILKSKLETILKQKNDLMNQIQNVQSNIDVTKNNLINLNDVSTVSIDDLQEKIDKVNNEKKIVNEKHTKILIEKSNLRNFLNETNTLNQKLTELKTKKENLTPTVFPVSPVVFTPENAKNASPPTQSSVLKTRETHELNSLKTTLQNDIHCMNETILKESICKSQIDSLKKNIVKVEKEVIRLLNITKTVNLTLMNENLSTLYQQSDYFNKIAAQKTILTKEVQNINIEKSKIEKKIGKTQKCNEDVNKLDFKVQKLEKVKSFNKCLNSIKEHLKQSFPLLETLEFTGHKSQLSVIKDFLEDAQKLGDNKAPKYKCPKCLHPLSIQHKNDKINLVSYIGEDILETIVKVNELLSEYYDNDNETTIEVMEEEIENIKDFKKLILEREAFQIQIEKLDEEIKNLPVLYDKSNEIQSLQNTIALYNANNIQLLKEETKLKEEKELLTQNITTIKLINEESNKIKDTYKIMIGIDKDITNEDIQTYLKKELSDLELELKERLFFERNLLIYNDIVSQIQTILDRQIIITEEITTIKKFIEEHSNIDELIDNLNQEHNLCYTNLLNKHKYEQYNTQLLNYTNLCVEYNESLNKLETDMETLKDQLKDDKKCYLELQKLQEYLKQIESFIKIQKKYELELNKFNEWTKLKNEYKKSVSNYETIINDLENRLIKLNNEYSASITLKLKISEAQNIALTSLVDTVNIYVQQFLDLFFEEPIVINLTMFKETDKKGLKATQPKVTVNLYYKGVLCPSDLSSLSSGEYARVSLAFTLAFHQINNNRVTPLMLDERTANLDQDLSTLIYSVIKENFPNQLLLVVAHQVITGPFDNIITLRDS